MARLFAVTIASATVVLDKNRAAVPVTVSNTGTQPVRGRARLVPLAGTPATWLNLTGESELDFATNQTRQYQVTIAAPPGAAPGPYSFRLDMTSVANPDDDVTEGPVVSFEVKPSPAPPPPFPIWIPVVAVVAVLLLVLGGVLLFTFWPRDAKPPSLSVRELDTADLKATLPKGGDPRNPLTITSVDELTKAFPDPNGQNRLKSEVDFGKDKLVFFAWSGSGQDRIGFDVRDNKVVFTFRRGKTLDLRSHARLFVLSKDAVFEVVTGP